MCFNYKATGWGNYSPSDIRIDNVKITIAYIPVYTGDLNSDGNIDKSDALYLLYHSIFGETMYPVNQDVDFNRDGNVDGVVGDTPSYYHGIFEDNGVDHVWHYVTGGTHDGVSIRAHVYNFVRYIFQAA